MQRGACVAEKKKLLKVKADLKNVDDKPLTTQP